MRLRISALLSSACSMESGVNQQPFGAIFPRKGFKLPALPGNEHKGLQLGHRSNNQLNARWPTGRSNIQIAYNKEPPI